MSLKIGIVGGGTFGQMHLRTFCQMREAGRGIERVALADTNPEVLGRRKQEYDVPIYPTHKQLLEQEELDAVAVVTPDFLHREITLDCIKANKHVLVEKPLDTTTEGCRQIAQEAEEAGLMVMVDFHKRYDPFHVQIKQTIEDGELGVPEYGYAWMEDRLQVPRDWFPDWAGDSSPGWFLGTHMVDLFRWCIGGGEGRRTWATGQKRKLPSVGIDTYDAVQAKVEFEDGISLHLDVSWILPDDFESTVNQGIRIVGSEGLCEVDSQARGGIISTAANGHSTINPVFFLENRQGDRTRYEGYGMESIAEFAQHLLFLQNGGSLEQLKGAYADAWEGLEVTRIVEGIHKSLVSQTLIEL